MSQDLDAVALHGDDDVSVLKRAISKGDNETVEQLLDNGKYSLHFLYDTLALNFFAVERYWASFKNHLYKQICNTSH